MDGPRKDTNADPEDELDALLDTYTAEAEAQIARQQEGNNKPQGKQGMAARRQAGLEQPLPQSNKGYQLLKKQGYQEGQGLGKSRSGQAEPLPLVLKSARTGLGIDEAKRQAQREAEARAQQHLAKRQRLETEATAAFQNSTRAAYQEAQALKHLHDAWKAAEQLEEQRLSAKKKQAHPGSPAQLNNTADAATPATDAQGPPLASLLPVLPALWPWLQALQSLPPVLQQQLEELQAEQEVEGVSGKLPSVEEQLRTLLQYLRAEHSYCLYCGAQYASHEDLLADCPGESEEDH